MGRESKNEEAAQLVSCKAQDWGWVALRAGVLGEEIAGCLIRAYA